MSALRARAREEGEKICDAERRRLAGKVGTPRVADEAPDWMKQGITDRTKSMEASGTGPQDDGDRTGPEGKTVH